MKRSSIVFAFGSLLVALTGCGGGAGKGSDNLLGADFHFGNLGGRAAISNPPVTTNSYNVTSTGLTGSISALFLSDTSPNLAETKIAFTSNRDGNEEIYLMNAEGSGLTNLTNNAANDFSPAWSPYGKKIAFTSYRDGNEEIYVMNADGSGQINLTNNAADDLYPAWSPDGKKIAFTSYRGGNDEIYVMNADGSGQTNLTKNAAYDANPTWSPEGKKIAFMSYRDGNYEIYVMNSDGSGQTNLTKNAAMLPVSPVAVTL